MATGFYDTSILANHNHTSTPGDGGTISNLSILGTLATTDDITSGDDLKFSATSTGGVVGTTTNDSAAVGNMGEYIESVAPLTNFPASTSYGDLAFIDLTAGDWDVTALSYGDIGTATWSVHIVGISSNTGNTNAGLVPGSNMLIDSFPTGTTRLISPIAIPNFRVSLASTVRYYLKFRATYSAGQPQATGRLSARRVR